MLCKKDFLQCVLIKLKLLAVVNKTRQNCTHHQALTFDNVPYKILLLPLSLFASVSFDQRSKSTTYPGKSALFSAFKGCLRDF